MGTMKTLLKLLGAISLTATTTSSVIACSSNEEFLNNNISQHLGLTDNDNNPLFTCTFAREGQNIVFNIKNNPIINASLLLNADNKAKDIESYDFITEELSIEPTEGNNFDNGIFSGEAKDKLTSMFGVYSNIKPILKPNQENNDYIVTGGTYNFQFKNLNGSGSSVGKLYTINLKQNLNFNVAQWLNISLTSLEIAETDIKTNPDILFNKNIRIPENCHKGTKIKISKFSFRIFKDLTQLDIIPQVESYTRAETWVTGSKITISYKTSDVNFKISDVKNEFVMA